MKLYGEGGKYIFAWVATNLIGSSQQGRREDDGIEPESNTVLTNRFDA